LNILPVPRKGGFLSLALEAEAGGELDDPWPLVSRHAGIGDLAEGSSRTDVVGIRVGIGEFRVIQDVEEVAADLEFQTLVIAVVFAIEKSRLTNPGPGTECLRKEP